MTLIQTQTEHHEVILEIKINTNIKLCPKNQQNFLKNQEAVLTYFVKGKNK